MIERDMETGAETGELGDIALREILGQEFDQNDSLVSLSVALREGPPLREPVLGPCINAMRRVRDIAAGYTLASAREESIRNVVAAMQDKRAQLAAYHARIAGDDEVLKHARAIADGRIQQIDQDIASLAALKREVAG